MAKVPVRIEGYVYDYQRHPIGGAKISLPEIPEGGTRWSRHRNGKFVFARVKLEEGEHVVHCDPPKGYQPPDDRSITVEAGQGKISVVLICAPAVQIVGEQIEGGHINMADGDLKQCCEELKDILKDIATFIPTKAETTGGIVGGRGVDGAVAARKVSHVVAKILGRPIGRDASTFLAALTATFPERDGKIVQTPVRAVVSLEAESGVLAASQGTLFHEIELIVNDALKVLDGLKSISPQTDEEVAEALKELVHSGFSALIEEAGRVDRPRKGRVDEIFEQLLRTDAVTGHLQQLREELGLDAEDALNGRENPDLIVTSEEAQLVASMDLLERYARILRGCFDTFFRTDAGVDPRDGSFSGRLAFVSTLFSVVAASVREVEADMDAVEFSGAERRTAFIYDPTTDVFDKDGQCGDQFLISIDSILSWIENFAVEEGPDLITSSGRFGLNRALEIVSYRLEPLVNELLQISNEIPTPDNHAPESPPHPGLTHSRVQNSLRQLANHLRQFNPHRPPVARFTVGSQTTTHDDISVNFDACDSSAGDRNIISYVWGFGDGVVERTTNPSITHNYTTPREYIVTLKVKDENSLTAYAYETVVVYTADYSQQTANVQQQNTDKSDNGQK